MGIKENADEEPIPEAALCHLLANFPCQSPLIKMIRVTMGADLDVEVGPEELTKRKPQEEGEERKKKKKETKDRKEGKEIAEKEIIPPTPPPVIPTAPPAIPASGDLEFSVFISPDGTVFKIGALCFVESLTIPILITRLFKSTISGKLFVSVVRCSCEGGGGGNTFTFAKFSGNC